MSLEEYRAKRNFRRTPEPDPRAGKGHRQPIFVIQQHHASHLHYDFRLEADGVLKSWAVPKEPTLDPSQKRLAIRVEDHPLSYAGFHGTIPEGEYGAGTVAIWDHGTYRNLLATKPQPLSITEGIKAGRLEIELAGEKLQGRFALIRMVRPSRGGKENWLLIKMKDEFAESTKARASRDHRPAFSNGKKAKTAALRPAAKQEPAAAESVRLTHPERILFPQSEITKGQVFDYYRRIAKRL